MYHGFDNCYTGKYSTHKLYEGQDPFERISTAEGLYHTTKGLLKLITVTREQTMYMTGGVLGFFAIIQIPFSVMCLFIVLGLSWVIYEYMTSSDDFKKHTELLIQFEREVTFYKNNYYGYVYAETQNIKRKNKKSEREKYERDKKYRDSWNHYEQNISRKSNSNQRGTFKECVTIKDVKRVYKLKAKKHHPDVGGDPETFKKLVVQYERALEIAKAS